MAALLALVAIGLWLGPSLALRAPAADAATAVVELVRGPAVLVLPDPDGGAPRRLAARAGMDVPEGAGIETSDGASDVLAVRLSGGASARFPAGSFATVTGDTLDLERGAVYVDSRRGLVDAALGGNPVEVRTTFGLVRDIGTQFEVRLPEAPQGGAGPSKEPEAIVPDLRLRVREGRVVYSGLDGESHGASAGEELRVLRSGAVERSQTPSHGADWQWVLAAARIPEVEGKSLGVFLDWLEREGGWSLSYEGTSLEVARKTTLFGNLEGLSAHDATPMIFAGSSLSYRIDEERLIISER